MGKIDKELERLLGQIEETKKLAESDPDDCDMRVRAGRGMAINQAKEDLPGLVAQYKQHLLANSAVYFINGPRDKVRKFGRLADELSTTLIITADALYRKLAELIEPQFGDSRQFLVDQYSRVLANFKELSGELGISQMSPLDLRSFPILNNQQESAQFIRGLIRDGNGDELNQLWIAHELAKAALEMRYKESVVHVLILGAELQEARNLSKPFGRLGSIVDIAEDSEVTADYVKEIFGEKKPKSKNAKQAKQDGEEQTSDDQTS